MFESNKVANTSVNPDPPQDGVDSQIVSPKVESMFLSAKENEKLLQDEAGTLTTTPNVQKLVKKKMKKLGKIARHKTRKIRGAPTRVNFSDRELEKQQAEVDKWRGKWMKSGPEGSLQGETSHINMFNDEDLTAQDFVKALSFQVPIGNLYEFVDHYAENETNELCAVLLRVADKNLRELVGNEYVLKVWNKQG